MYINRYVDFIYIFAEMLINSYEGRNYIEKNGLNLQGTHIWKMSEKGEEYGTNKMS